MPHRASLNHLVVESYFPSIQSQTLIRQVGDNSSVICEIDGGKFLVIVAIIEINRFVGSVRIDFILR